MFAAHMYILDLDENDILVKQLNLNKYTVLATDDENEIRRKNQLLINDVCYDRRCEKHPIQFIQHFENDVNLYYKERIERLRN